MKLNEHPTVMQYREKVEEDSLAAVREKLDSMWLKTVALEAGADDAGLVEIGCPELEEHAEDILKVFPRTRSLMSIVCRMNPENIRCPSRDVSDLARFSGRGKESHMGVASAKAPHEGVSPPDKGLCPLFSIIGLRA